MPPSAHWLSLSIWVPIVAGLAVLATGADKNAREARIIALVGAGLGLVVTIPLVAGFDTGTSAMQFVEKAPWIERFNVNYHLGVDGISVLFILLNSFVTVLVVIAGWEVIRSTVAQYMAAFFVMSALLNGTFAALDAVLFYVFFESTLIPMYLVIGVWGGPNRVYAAVKFFLYTLLGSLLMLVAFLYLYNKSGGSFAVLDYHKLPLPFDAQILLFIAFLMAFAVKVPMWPGNPWLPDAQVEAPTGVSAVLAAILLKLGAIGFVRFSLPILPDASRYLAGFMITLSLIAIVYIGLVALVQTDMKKLIAYSSISHMGFVKPSVTNPMCEIEEYAISFFISVCTSATDRNRIHRTRGAGADRYEEADRVFLDLAHGVRDARLLHLQRLRNGRGPGADDLARLRLRGALPVRGRDVRPHALAQHRRLRGGREHHAQVRRPDDAVRDGQLRAAGDLRLRRRVHGDPGRDEVQLLDRLPRGNDPRLRRRLHPVDGQARDLRRGWQPARGGALRRQRARAPGPRAARDRRAVAGRPPGPLP